MTGRYIGWAGPLEEVGRFEWERIIKKCDFSQMSTKLIALVLATYANEDGGRIYPGRERLAAVASLSTKQTSRAMVKLEELGLVFKVHDGQHIGKRGLASVYQLTVPKMLSTLYADDKDELVRLVHEAAYTYYLAKDQGTPMSPGSQEIGTPMSHAPTPDLGTYETNLGTYETNLGTYEADLGTPMSLHQGSFTKDLSSSISHQSISAASSPSVTHARAAVDNSTTSIEDERRRQMEGLQRIIEEEKRIAS